MNKFFKNLSVLALSTSIVLAPSTAAFAAQNTQAKNINYSVSGGSHHISKSDVSIYVETKNHISVAVNCNDDNDHDIVVDIRYYHEGADGPRSLGGSHGDNDGNSNDFLYGIENIPSDCNYMTVKVSVDGKQMKYGGYDI